MKNNTISKDWEKLIGKNSSKVESSDIDIKWVFELLGWEKNVRTNRNR